MSANPAARLSIEEIPLDACVVEEEYQRTKVRKRIVDRIVNDYRVELDEPITVAPVGNGRYAVIDGQHRVIGKRKLGHTTATARICPRRKFAQRAGVYTDINTERTGLSPLEIFKGELASSDPDALALADAVAAAGMRVSGTEGPGKKVSAIKSLKAIMDRQGAETLTEVLTIVQEAWPNSPEARKAYYVNGVARFLSIYGERFDRARLVRQLGATQPMEVRMRGAQFSDFSSQDGRAAGMCRAMVQLYNRNMREENRLELV